MPARHGHHTRRIPGYMKSKSWKKWHKEQKKKRKENPGVSSIMNWALILGGGYVVLELLGINPITTFEKLLGITPTTTDTTTTGASTTTSVVSGTLQLVANAAIAAGVNPNTQLFTFDQWNYYYQAVRGIPGPDPKSVVGYTPGENISITEWWSYMSNSGFSGLGTIGHGINPYSNPQGTPFRQNLIPRGIEKSIFVVGS